MNFLTSLRTLILALVLSIGVSYAYAAWAPPTQTPPNGNIYVPVNVGAGSQTKQGSLLSDNFFSAPLGFFGSVGIGVVSPTEKLDVAGNIKASGNLQAPTICLSGDCKSAWPVASGSTDWSSITNRPTQLDDKQVNYPADIVGLSPGLADNVDDVGVDRGWVMAFACVPVLGGGNAPCPAGWTSYQSVTVPFPGACNVGLRAVATSCYKSF